MLPFSPLVPYAQDPGDGSGLFAGLLFIWLLFALCLYFAPLVIAAFRKVPNLGSIAVVNVFLGWTLVGWVVAFAMAARSGSPSGQIEPRSSSAPVP